MQYKINCMSPAEAPALEEPNWRDRFEDHCLRWPKLPRDLAEDNAFETTLSDWRNHYGIDVEVQGQEGPELKRKLANEVDGVIALAELELFPARNLFKYVPRGGFGYQHDDHCWLSIGGEQWRITGVDGRILMLELGFADEPLRKTIDLNRVRWEKYVEAAIAVLNGA